MGGPATLAGTNYQAGVIVFVFVHMPAQRRLGWLTPLDDTPLAVSAETGGPGDDVEVEFGEAQALEVRAKAGLTGDAALTDAIRGTLRGSVSRGRDRETLSSSTVLRGS